MLPPPIPASTIIAAANRTYALQAAVQERFSSILGPHIGNPFFDSSLPYRERHKAGLAYLKEQIEHNFQLSVSSPDLATKLSGLQQTRDLLMPFVPLQHYRYAALQFKKLDSLMTIASARDRVCTPRQIGRAERALCNVQCETTISILCELLQSGTFDPVAESAQRVLQTISSDIAHHRLLSIFNLSPSPESQFAALSSIRGVQSDSVQRELIAIALTHGTKEIQCAAVKALAQTTNEEALSWLATLNSQTQNERLNSAMAEALQFTTHGETINKLIETATTSENVERRRLAYKALGGVQGEGVVDFLVSRLYTDILEVCQTELIMSLGLCNTKESRAALIERIQKPQGSLLDLITAQLLFSNERDAVLSLLRVRVSEDVLAHCKQTKDPEFQQELAKIVVTYRDHRRFCHSAIKSLTRLCDRTAAETLCDGPVHRYPSWLIDRLIDFSTTIDRDTAIRYLTAVETTFPNSKRSQKSREMLHQINRETP